MYGSRHDSGDGIEAYGTVAEADCKEFARRLDPQASPFA